MKMDGEKSRKTGKLEKVIGGKRKEKKRKKNNRIYQMLS